MSIKRYYRLIFTEETVTDENVVIDRKPVIKGQICLPEQDIVKMSFSELFISMDMLQKLYEGLKDQLQKQEDKMTKDVINDLKEAYKKLKEKE